MITSQICDAVHPVYPTDNRVTAKSIVRDVIRKRLLDPEEFFGRSRRAELVEARIYAAKQLRDHGCTVARIARILERNCTTISNYLYENMRESKRQRYVKKHGKTVKIRPEYLPKLAQLAALTGASVEAFVNQCVSDALESA